MSSRASTRPRCTVSPPAAPHAAPPLATIQDIITDMLAKQSRLSALLDEEQEIEQLATLLQLHGQNASRLGRLLRDQRALSGESADGLLDAIGKALDELGTELGTQL